jgi:hypothetical protein
LHQDIFEALQRYIDELECVGGGEVGLDPVRVYETSSKYSEVLSQIKEIKSIITDKYKDAA